MSYYHGIKTRQASTSISTPVTASSGVTFVVGTAPVHTVPFYHDDDEKKENPIWSVNELVYASNYSEAVSKLGYSDDWKTYSLCEVMYNHFKLYATSPVIFVNVFNPESNKGKVENETCARDDNNENIVKLPFEAIKETVKVEGFEEGTDYTLFYDENNLIMEIKREGKIKNETEFKVSYQKVDPKIEEKDIIGKSDKEGSTGLELVNSVFPKYSIVPDIIICPGWSHDAEVAANMSTKAAKINEIFGAVAICDVDVDPESDECVRHYSDVNAWKKSKNIFSKHQILCYPMCKLGDKTFHMSTQMAGLMATVDSKNGDCPAESPSNKLMQINSTVLADGTEVLLDLNQANTLNSNGIVTAINMIGGFVLWGNETACYPANTDVKDYFISVSRMFNWVANSVILTYWSKVDNKLTRRFVDSVADSLNIWLNGLTSEEKLLGGHVEFRDEDNTLTALMSGKAVFHIFITPPSPAKEIEFVLEYSIDYVKSALLS